MQFTAVRSQILARAVSAAAKAVDVKTGKKTDR
jgi:hypothetical protein